MDDVTPPIAYNTLLNTPTNTLLSIYKFPMWDLRIGSASRTEKKKNVAFVKRKGKGRREL